VDDDEALRSRIEVSSAAPADQVSAAALDHVASFEPLASHRLAGGNQRLALGMARRLGPALRLGETVLAVEQHDAGVQVRTRAGELGVDEVVVALPLGVLRQGDVAVPLTAEKRSALGRLVQGHAAKLHVPLATTPATSAVLSVPGRFWTWTALDAEETVAPVVNSFAGSAPSLARLEVGAGSERWLSAVRAVRADLDLADAAPLLTTWADDPYARGAYTEQSPDFTAEHQRALDAPVGSVHLAGEYLDAEFTGLMEGALRSGRRAAASVLARTRRA
jgi:monoamine oxidase